MELDETMQCESGMAARAFISMKGYVSGGVVVVP
jgi:hypothetical protein